MLDILLTEQQFPCDIVYYVDGEGTKIAPLQLQTGAHVELCQAPDKEVCVSF